MVAGWVLLVLSYFGRFFVCMSFGVIYLYGPELFPTVVRASVMSFTITFARIGGILSPYLADVVSGGGTGDSDPKDDFPLDKPSLGQFAPWKIYPNDNLFPGKFPPRTINLYLAAGY